MNQSWEPHRRFYSVRDAVLLDSERFLTEAHCERYLTILNRRGEIFIVARDEGRYGPHQDTDAFAVMVLADLHGREGTVH